MQPTPFFKVPVFVRRTHLTLLTRSAFVDGMLFREIEERDGTFELCIISQFDTENLENHLGKTCPNLEWTVRHPQHIGDDRYG